MCYHAEFGCSMSNRVRKSSGEPAKVGSVRATPPWDGGGRGWPPKSKAPPHMCYHAQFGRFSLKQCIVRGQPRNWGALVFRPFGTGTWLTTSNLVVLRQVCTHKYKGTSKLGSARRARLRGGAWLSPRNKPPPYIYYHQIW